MVGGGTANGTSFIGGGQFGYNFQSGNIVYGFEVDGSWLSGSATTSINAGALPYTAEQKINWLVTARARLGLAVGNALVYATGGLAVGGVENSVALPIFGVGATTSESETRLGWVIGGGAEGMIARNWTVGLEGLFVDLGKGDPIVPLLGAPWQSRFSNQAVIGRVKVNYKF
jgi:outer membrane immunogenic protein